MSATLIAETKFKNELGNEVHLTVSNDRVEGYEYVLIEMAGPHSDTTHRITRGEAQRLKSLLDYFV